MSCSLGQRSISPECLQDVPTISDRMRSLPEDSRKCTKCGTFVGVHIVSTTTDPVGASMPIDGASVTGCEKMLDRAIETFIEKFSFAECFEREKSEKVSGVSH
ncbi:MAG: hypothetical protein QOE96_2870 [Blastocatellia bacterium]|nr:hypothetical protein [Blastocatellia bacterium]